MVFKRILPSKFRVFFQDSTDTIVLNKFISASLPCGLKKKFEIF